jgi:hypothetical protein
MSRRKNPQSKPKPLPPGVLRLPSWWQPLAHRLDWAGRLAERWEPTFSSRWLALTAIVFPLLLILLAFLFTPYR